MATVYVEGVVSRIFFEGRGVQVTESFVKRDGSVGSAKYVCWFEQAPVLNVGDAGTFSGLLSAQIEDWVNEDGSAKLDNQGKLGRSVKLALNNAKFKQGMESGVAPVAPSFSGNAWESAPASLVDDPNAPF